MKEVHIWSDGACSGNPGEGGYSAAMMISNDTALYASGYEEYTTNNRMELMGFLIAVEMAKKDPDFRSTRWIIHTDSKYISNSLELGWLNNWIKKGIISKKKNPDLWILISRSLKDALNIHVEWCKGHSGIQGNELVNELARAALVNKKSSVGYIRI